MVGLVEHGDLDVGEGAGGPVEQVDQAARGGDHDVDPAAQPVDLPADGDATVDRHDGGPELLAEGRERGRDLYGEFSGRDEYQAARRLRAPVPALDSEPGQHRQAEGERLAGAGLRAAEDIPACQRVRYGAGLDGERRDHAVGGQCIDEPSGQAKLAKGGVGGLRCGGRCGQREIQGADPVGARRGRPVVQARFVPARSQRLPGGAGTRPRGGGRNSGAWMSSVCGSGAASCWRRRRQRQTGAHREADCSHKRPRGLLARGSGSWRTLP